MRFDDVSEPAKVLCFTLTLTAVGGAIVGGLQAVGWTMLFIGAIASVIAIVKILVETP